MTDPGAHADDPLYFDHNATTPVAREVVEAMLPYLREHFGNPSSTHVYGRRTHRAVETARAQVAELLGAEPDEIVFTSGGTESSNLAIGGALAGADRGAVLTSVVEHPATAAPCRKLEAQGWRVARASVDETGRVDVAAAIGLMGDDLRLITVMHANNETGTLQPIAELARAARERGALVHTDAAQSVGKVAARVDELGVDLLTVAGHKLYAPKGVGALYVRRGVSIAPVVVGAGHERGLRPGTENVASIVGLGAACELARTSLAREAERVRALRDELHRRLRERVPGLALNGHPEERLPNTLNVRFPGVLGSAVLAAAPRVAASTGSACHEDVESASGVLRAMGLDDATALGSVRLSLGRHTTSAVVEEAADLLAAAFERVRAGR